MAFRAYAGVLSAGLTLPGVVSSEALTSGNILYAR